MRVGVVSHAEVHGGAEEYLLRLSRELGRHDISEVLIGSIPGWTEEQVELSLSRKWTLKTLLPSVSRLRSEQARLRSALQAVPVDLFHVQFKREQIGFSHLLAKRAPVVWTEHGVLNGRISTVLRSSYRRAATYADQIICVSDAVAASVEAAVSPSSASKISVIPNPADTTRFAPPTDGQRADARQKLGLPPDALVVAWVGRLSPSKQPETAAKVARVWPGHVLVAGEGPRFDELTRIAEGMENLHVLGRVDPLPVYHAADVLLFTSSGAGEGYPTTTMLEAAACGLSIVANSAAGADSILAEMGATTLDEHANSQDWVRTLTDATHVDHRTRARQWAISHDVQSWSARHAGVFEAAASRSRRAQK